MLGCAVLPPVVTAPRMVATADALFSSSGVALAGGAGLDYIWVLSAIWALDVTMAIYLFSMESALSIAVRSSNSSNSSDTDSAMSVTSEGGANSFPLREAMACSFTIGFCCLLCAGLSTSISTNSPDGGVRRFAANSIIFGADVVGVADVVGAAKATLHVRCVRFSLPSLLLFLQSLPQIVLLICLYLYKFPLLVLRHPPR
jgi:hypothetical protein